MSHRQAIGAFLVIGLTILSSLWAWQAKSDSPSNSSTARTPTTEPPIHEAARNGDIETLEALIEDGVDIEEKYLGRTPIEQATFYDKPDAVKILATAGAEVGRRDALGQTPLFSAQSVATARALVAHGAEIDIRDDMGEPLIISISYRYPEIAQFLIESGADLQLTDDRSRSTILMAACSQDQVDFVKFLLAKGMDVNQQSAFGTTALTDAASHGNTTIAKLLIEHGADVNVRSKADGRTALHTAAADGYLDFVILLLESDADYTVRDFEGLTPLGAALAYQPYPGRVSKPTFKQQVIRLVREREEEK